MFFSSFVSFVFERRDLNGRAAAKSKARAKSKAAPKRRTKPAPAPIASATATLLFRQFFMTIPKELVEASKMDGAGPIRYISIIMIMNGAKRFTMTRDYSNF